MNVVCKFEEMNNLLANHFELSFYQEGNDWKHKLVPIEVSENILDRARELLILKNHYVLNKNLRWCLGIYDSTFVCKRCLSSIHLKMFQ